MPRVPINGFDLYFDEKGFGVPVVYVHGGFACLASALSNSPTDGSDWTWENDFAQRFHFVEYDRRGCYRSSYPDGGYDLLNEARDLEGLLDHLGIASAHLIGSSAGGPIAMIFAATQPMRTRSLVLTGTAMNLFSYGDDATRIVQRQIEVLEQEGPEATFDKRPPHVEVALSVLWAEPEQAERGALDQYRAEQRMLNERATQLPQAERVHYYAAELKSMKGYMDIDVSTYARQIQAPTLALHGSNDREVPLVWGEEMAHAIPSAQLDVLQGESHSLIIRNPEARQKAIAFIQQIESRG